MSAKTQAPVIIKRKKIIVEAGHHGGAWKVAYADFVTAMMAFFMLMWLLNATTEKQRKGLADFFNPTIPITRASGGGDHALGGESVFSQNTLTQMGQGGLADGMAALNEEQLLQDIAADLSGRGGESMAADNSLRHIVTRVTDHGLIVELFDLPGHALFQDDTAQPTEQLKRLIGLVAETFALSHNAIAIGAHLQARPVVEKAPSGWDLTADRARVGQALLIDLGIDPNRIARIVGHSTKSPGFDPAMDPRNTRLEFILLRSPTEK